jgi:dihydrofolate reductase
MKLIACLANNNVIGVNGKIPWHSKKDLKYFKDITMDNVVVMGKNTYLSLFPYLKNKDDEPLPGRTKVVLTNNPNQFDIAKCQSQNTRFIQTIESLNYSVVENTLNYLEKSFSGKEIFVIGGEKIYSFFKGCYNDLLLTRIHINISVDENSSITYFPLSNQEIKNNFNLVYEEIDSCGLTNICFQQWKLKSLYNRI